MDEAQNQTEEIQNVFSDKKVRIGFIRKTLALFTTQIAITCGACLYLYFFSETKIIDFLWASPMLLRISCGVICLFIAILANCTDFGRRTPNNYILLLLFNLSFTLIVMQTCAMNTRLILPAIVITFTICSVLTIYALITPYDFTIWGGALVMMLLQTFP